MAQYDLLLTQNISSGGTEWAEKKVLLVKGSILTADAASLPTVLDPGTDGFMLTRADGEATGLKWAAIPAGHTQNTDTGTTNTTFSIDSDGFNLPITAESASKLGIKVAGGATYADLQAKDATFNKVTISTAPSAGTDAVNKTYVDGILSSNDAMVFKGTVGTSGTHEIAAFNSLSTYQAGWSYKVITAGTIKGKVCEVGDLLIATIDRSGSGQLDTDWTVVQTNVDGAVVGPGSATDNNIVSFNSTTGKIIKDSGVAVSAIATAQSTANAAVPKSAYNLDTILVGTAAGAYTALTPGASTIVGKAASGSVVALTATQVRTILNVADGANNYSHPNHTGDVTSVADGATTIAAGAVTLAKMANVATGTVFYRKTAATGAPEVQSLATLKADLGTMPIAWSSVPATATAAGSAGSVAYDTSGYLYVCTATNVWKRAALATW